MKPAKLKINKNFEPPQLDVNDEIFPNGIFQFNISKLLNFIKQSPDGFLRKEVEVETLYKKSPHDQNPSAIDSANLETPIILAEISPGRFNVIDGNHRVEKARRLGVKKLFAYKVHPEQHVNFLISNESYKKYVEYWNSKVDEAE